MSQIPKSDPGSPYTIPIVLVGYRFPTPSPYPVQSSRGFRGSAIFCTPSLSHISQFFTYSFLLTFAARLRGFPNSILNSISENFLEQLLRNPHNPYNPYLLSNFGIQGKIRFDMQYSLSYIKNQ